MDFKLKIDIGDIEKEITDKIKNSLEKDLNKIVKDLGKSAVQHLQQLSEQFPKELEKKYKDNIYIEHLADNIVEVGLREEVAWIDQGRKPGFMQDLLERKSGSEVKTSKDGNKYRVIPFEHKTQGPSKSAAAADLVNQLKQFLKSEGVAYSKTRALQKDEKGNPRIGKIQSFNIKNMRESGKKSAQKLSPNLEGLSIYQNLNPNTGKVERNIMTFRVISEKHRGTGKWEHPGLEGKKTIDKTFDWVKDKWEKEILPELKKKYESK
jgi:hypothetical protein